jgi:type 1 glutamine amidotransferase
MKVIFEKKNSSFPNMKSYLDTHLRVVHVVPIAGRRVVLGPLFFSTSGHSRPKFDQPRMKAIWKKWNYGFKNIKQFFDTHLRDKWVPEFS